MDTSKELHIRDCQTSDSVNNQISDYDWYQPDYSLKKLFSIHLKAIEVDEVRKFLTNEIQTVSNYIFK